MVKNFSNLLRSETNCSLENLALHMAFLKSSYSTVTTCEQQGVLQALCETRLCH